MKPKISIVIPSMRHLDDCLKPCCESIIKYTDLSDIEVVVVLNGCGNDGSREYIQSLENAGYPFRYLWLEDASGYTHSTNVGIQSAQGDYLLLLNNDCVLLGDDWVPMLLQPFLDDPQVGITGPLMLHCPDADEEFLVFFCVMIRRECLESIGGKLDEAFSPGYGEDCAASIEARRAGWKVLQVPPSQAVLADKGCEDLPQWKREKMWTNPFSCYHDGNRSFSEDPERFNKILERNKKILQERYGNKLNTPTGNCPRCNGQMIDGTCVGEEGKLNCDGLYLWRAAQIDGWFGVDEGAWIAQQVKALPHHSKILSVGAWHGRSSRFIADNLSLHSQLWDCDSFLGSSGEPEMHGTAHWDRGDHAFQWYWCNLHEHIMAGNVVPVRMWSENAAHTLGHLIDKGEMKKFSLIFLDGDHSEEGIQKDIDAWFPLLADGGMICGHDYYQEHEGPHWVHVRQTVESKFPNVEKSATSIWHVRPEARKPQIVDAIPFNDELLLLETRWSELDPVVNRFVLSESPISHSGNPKPLFFTESLEREPERWTKWRDKITVIVVDDFNLEGLEGSQRHWAIERHQRDSLMRGLVDCRDDDIIIISDTDEIPRASAVASYEPSKGLCCLEMKLYYGSMNCEGLEPWRWTRMLTYGQLKTISPCGARYVPNYDKSQVIKDGGWHFSFCGTPDDWVRKLENTPHQEYNKPEFKDKAVMLDRVMNGRDLLGRNIPYHLVSIDESFPQFVRDNIERFKASQFILEPVMHPEAYSYVARVKEKYPEFFKGKKVLEVGSLIINGTVRDFFEECKYHGIDLADGPGVDEVISAHRYFGHNGEYDVVVCTEVLEHDQEWKLSLAQMYQLLKPGGLLLITCAGPTRPEHGTTRTDTYSSPFTTDYYRNISQDDFLGVLKPELFSECEIGYQRGEEDLVFYGIKQNPKEIIAPEGAKGLTALVNERGPIQLPTITESFTVPKHGGIGTVTACVSTKDRMTTTLPMCLSAIITQTRKPDKLKIYDDGEQLDLREIAPFDGLLKMCDERGIDWEILQTPRKGQVSNHQHCLDHADTDWIYRVDDDEIPMPNCLERLMNTVRDFGIGGDIKNIAAVGGLVHHPGNVGPVPEFLDGSLKDIAAGLNLSWYKHKGLQTIPRTVEHLYSTFLLNVEKARKVGGYPKTLSPVGHREESIITHLLHRAGWKVVFQPEALTYHLRQATGGIRSFNDQSMWEHDEEVWQGYLKEWGMNGSKPTKVIVLDCGIGDHYAFKSILPKLREIHADKELILSVCYPNVLTDEGLKLISIADAKTMLGERYDSYSIYRMLWERDWKGSLAEGMLEVLS